MNRKLSLLVGVVTLGLTLGGAEDWPHWRGRQRTGIVDEPSGWDGKSWRLREAWSTSVGLGASSPIANANSVFTMGWSAGRETVFCLEAATGKVSWRQSYSCPQYGRYAVGDQSFYSGPGATPVWDARSGALFTLSADGDLNCWDTNQQGHRVWGFNLYERYGVGRRAEATRRAGAQRDYGYTTSPLLQGDWLIVEVGDDEGNLMAFEARNGARVWTSQNKWPAGHSGGLVPMTVAGVPCVAVFTLKGLLVARLDANRAGETVAEVAWATDFANNIATPAVHGDSILITSGYNQHKMVRLQVTLTGVKRVWEQPYLSGVCSPIIYDGQVYWANRGLHCLDFATGELRWVGGKFGDAASCVVTRDGRVIVWANDGDLTLAETAQRSPDHYLELASVRLPTREEAWPHLALAGGRLLCKGRDGSLRCLMVTTGQP